MCQGQARAGRLGASWLSAPRPSQTILPLARPAFTLVLRGVQNSLTFLPLKGAVPGPLKLSGQKGQYVTAETRLPKPCSFCLALSERLLFSHNMKSPATCERPRGGTETDRERCPAEAPAVYSGMREGQPELPAEPAASQDRERRW